MKQGLKKLPAPLRKQALLRFAGAGDCFLLLCGMALGTGQAGLCLPFFVLGIFLAGTGAGLVRLSCQGKILTLETVCQEVEKTWFRRRAKALVLRCGERTLRVYLRGRRDRVSPGSRVQLFLAESTPVYEEEGVLVLGEYLGLCIAQ